MAKKGEQVSIEGRILTLTNADKVLYPGSHFTKAHVIDYYVRVSKWLLPHFRNRPVTLNRFPDGVHGQTFYEKDAPSYAPEWIQIAPVPRRNGGADIRYILINDLPTLVWCANIAALELHPFLHCAPNIDRPNHIVFDLDPGAGADAVTCARVAVLLREKLREVNLECFPKISGSKGIQVYVPLNTPTSYSVTQPFALEMARTLEKLEPKLVVSEMAKHLRTGKVFVDWSQNSDFKTTVGVYSLRAKKDKPFVSLPVTWDEVEKLLKKKDADLLCFAPDAALARLEKVGDLFEPVLQLRQKLPGTSAKPIKTRKRAPAAKKAEDSALPARSRQGSQRRFVIQQHLTNRPHFDFRLETENALQSWAVPKGLPLEPKQKRLAMATEDHPLSYLEFEGVIPEGQYGGGTVVVWDIGRYDVVEGSHPKGKLHISLDGRKLKGEWLLTRGRREDGKTNWYVQKVNEGAVEIPAGDADRSAMTGRTAEEIRSDGAVWHSNRTDIPGLELDSLPKLDAGFIAPMQALPGSELPEGDSWTYEIKLDGYRALAFRSRGDVALVSRRNNRLNARFPGVAKALEPLEEGVLLDGEIVALDAEGRPSFHLLQNAKGGRRVVVFYVFDVLGYRGRSLMRLPLTRRREILEYVVPKSSPVVRISAVLDASAAQVIAAAREQRLEGVVAKRANSFYEPGGRSSAWTKFRINQGQELVIAGYKPGKDGFDNLAAGYYDDGGKLIFIAKIKNGFTPTLKREIANSFDELATDECPFANLPEPRSARRGEALTEDAMKKYRWLRPELVAQVEFADWTAADHLRHSRFVALRDDKLASEVVREKAGAAG